MVTTVPPLVGPLDGEMPVTTGVEGALGRAVASTDAVAEAVVALSKESVMVVLVVRDPLAEDPTSTVALIVPSAAPAGMGRLPEYVQVSTVLVVSVQVQPVPEPAAEKVSPFGNVEVTIGSFSAGPPVELIEGLSVSV
jgi:hypothetical protein